MKILVCVKQVYNETVKISHNFDHTGIKVNSSRYCINPFDEIAIEEAIRLKEAQDFEVIILGVGPSNIKESLLKALAMGANRAILVDSVKECSTLEIAKVITKIAIQEDIGLIIMGKQSIDGDYSHTGQMVAGLLNWSQGTNISKLTMKDGHIDVIREVDHGLETLSLKLPSVVTTDLRLNEPRYLSLPNILKAKKKELKKIDFDSFLDIVPHRNYKITYYDMPPKRKAGVILTTAKELVEKLQLHKMVVK